MDSYKAINIVRDTLREHLDDPYVLAGGEPRANFIFTDEPLFQAKFPRIQVREINNHVEPISIGPEYMESEHVIIGIIFYVKDGFKVKVDGEVLSNEQLVEKYKKKIRNVLKTNFLPMHRKGIIYKAVKSTPPQYDSENNLHQGTTVIDVWFFDK